MFGALSVSEAFRQAGRTGIRRSARFLVPALRRAVDSVRDLAPIVLVIAFFQIAVLQQPFPNLENVVIGLVCVCVGLALFVQGLEIGLFPLGEALARGFARKGSPGGAAVLRLLPGVRHHRGRAGPDCSGRRGR